MKRRFLAVGFLVFAGLACLWLASRAVTAAKPPGGPVLSPSVSVPVPVAEPAHPDLVVAQVRFVKYHQADIPYADLTVRVKNIGRAQAASCKLALEWISDYLDPHARQTATLEFPALAPGATADRSATLTGIGFLPLKGMLIAAVDPAMPGKPAGEVSERSGEYNNVFGFTFTIPSDAPILWRNPPVPLRESPHADLVVTEVQLTRYAVNPPPLPPGTPWSPFAQVSVVVKNIGTSNSPACTLAVEHTWNYLAPTSSVARSAQLPPLAPGATQTVPFGFGDLRVNLSYPWSGMLIAAVDPALAGKPAGEVAEASGEFNNVFGFTTNGPPRPQSSSPASPSPTLVTMTWKNPAAQ
jgi:hypothetical protein